MSYPINITVGQYTSANNYKVQALDPVSLAVEATQTFLPTGGVHPIRDVTLFVPESKVYIIRVVEVTGGGDVVKHEATYDASTQTFSTVPDIDYVVNRSVNDPVEGQTDFLVPALAGKRYRLVQRGVGPLVPGFEWDYLEAGGFKLLGGATFAVNAGIGDTYFVQFLPDSTTSPDDLYLVVGRGLSYDPLEGAVQYRNSSLAGQSYRVEQRGIGPRRTDEITIVSVGGWDLLGGELFNFNDTWIVHFYPTIILQSPTVSGTGKEYEDIIEITADTVYDAAHLGKLILAKGAGTTIKYSLPLGASIPAGKCLAFKNTGKNAKFLTLETAAGQDVQFHWNTTEVLNDQIWIGQNELIKLQWKTDKWVIINNWNLNDVGKLDDGYKVHPNTLWLNGSLPVRAEQPRLWFIISTFFPDMLLSEPGWATEKGFYSVGDGSTTFRLPDWTDQTAKAVNNTSRIAGSKQAAQVGEFTLDPIKAKSTQHSSSSTALTGVQKLLVNNAVDEGNITIKGSGAIQQTGKENTVKNFGVIKLVVC